MKLDIKYMQQLDFLLRIVNSCEESQSYKIYFGYKGKDYTGNFIPNDMTINLKDRKFSFKLLDVDNLNNQKTYKFITPSNSEWKSMYQGNFISTDLGILIYLSDQLKTEEYMYLLNSTLEKHSIDFGTSLPSFIYNAAPINNYLPLDVTTFEVSETAEFDYVSLVKKEN